MPDDEPLPPGSYEGTPRVLNAELMYWLTHRRMALAIETNSGRWAAIIRKTVRAWVQNGPSPNDFAVISGDLFTDWDERLTSPCVEELAVKATLAEAQAFLADWKRSPA